MKYRNKVTEIEAVRCRAVLHSFLNAWSALPTWVAAAYERGGMVATDDRLHIGDEVAFANDMLIRGSHDEIITCKPSTFDELYEQIEDTLPDAISPRDMTMSLEITADLTSVKVILDAQIKALQEGPTKPLLELAILISKLREARMWALEAQAQEA